MTYNVCRTLEEFIITICENIKEESHKTISKKDSFTLVLSGGNTPKFIFDELSTNYLENINWSKVHIFWLDERCVPPSHNDSNFKLAYEYLLSKIENIGSIHKIKGELPPIEAAKLYEEEILDFFGTNEVQFDFILLGMGEDGHVASLFPNSKEVGEQKKLVISTKKKYNGYKRISLTLPIINKSDKLLMINNNYKLQIFKDRGFPIHSVNNGNMKVIILS